MRLINSVAIVLALCALSLNGQTQISAITGTSPIVTTGFGGSTLQLGSSTPLYYAVVANFVGGSIPSEVITIRNGPLVLSATSFVAFQWSPVAGATSYDLLKLTSASIPSTASSTGLHTGLTTTSSTDTGTSTASYTLAAPPSAPGNPFIFYQSRDFTPPVLYVTGIGAIGGAASSVTSFDGRVGAVTLLAADVDSVGAITNSTSGNAATATALAATPTLCSTGQAPTGVLANGNATGCAAIPAGGVTTFNGRAGVVALLAADVNGVGAITNPTSGTAALASALAAAYIDWNAGSGGASILNKPTIPTVTGGTCTNQVATAISAAAIPTCTTVTSAYVNNSIALTGTDINTSNQVTVTHLTSALPINQGGTGATSLPGSSGNFLYNNAGALGAKAITSGDLPGVPITISTSGPVADPGGVSNFQVNNAAGALTFNLAAGVAGYQRCYRNATGKSGVITIAVTTSNSIDLNGANGTTTTGTLVSGGALGDAVCLWSDATNHWYAQVSKGTWTNN